MSAIAPEETMLQQPLQKQDSVKMQRRLFKFMNTPAVQLFLIFLLMLSLFLADSWTCGNAPDSANGILYGILSFVLFCFAMESVILSVVQENYFLSFFFFMDVLGTLSIILDIGWIADAFLPSGVHVNGSILRATRAAKLGARYGRLMRLLKLMKFMHYLPCFAQKEEDTKSEPTMSAVRRVSRQLSTALTQKVAALVMLIVIVVPFLQYAVTDFSAAAWVASTATYMSQQGSGVTDAELTGLSERIKRFYRGKDMKFLGMTIEQAGDTSFETSYKTRDVLREANKQLFTDHYTDTLSEKQLITIRLDMTVPNSQDSMFGILLIILVIGVLFSFSASFQSAIDQFVVAPLEKTMNALRNSATVMLKSMKAFENEKKEEEKKKKDQGDNKDRDEDGDYDPLDSDDEEGGDGVESQMLEKMVDKLARIVKHMVPEEKIEIGGNVDASTAAWIAGTFSSDTKEVEQEVHHIVDEKAEKTRLDSLSAKTLVSLSALNSWTFDVLKYEDDQLIGIFSYLFAVLNVFEDFKVPTKVFNEFMKELSSRYINSNTYHNFKHGCDVAHTVYRLIFDSSLNVIMSRLEVFSMILAGLAHDVGHPGVNNPFLMTTKDPLALRYNDRSPLENMHCASLYEIMSKGATNIFVGLTDKQWRDSRKLIVTAILGTDMSHHNEQISKARLFLEVSGEDTKAFSSMQKDTIDAMSDEKNRIFILELVLHCADISNPFKPFNICESWALLVVEEFFAQGDREKREGFPVSPMMDRNTVILCNMQMGFIEFAVAPLISTFVKIFPGLYEIVMHMRDNFCAWGEKRKAEVNNDPNIADKAECGRLDDRMKKFRDNSAYCEEFKALPKRVITGKHTN